MTTLPKVSVIVPVHNAAATLDACVQSILGQDYPHIECILVENGSTDTSSDICKRYSDSEERIRLAVGVCSGVSEARNLGLSMATGDIIGFCDADDLLEPGAIRTVVSTFQENPDIVSVIGAFYVGPETTEGIQKRYKGLRSRRLSAEEAIELTIGNNNVMGSVWNKYYRADALKGCLFDTSLSYSEDTHFNVKALSALTDKSVMLINAPLYCYVQCVQSVTHQSQNLFDDNGELKYIIALKKILSDGNLKPRCRSIAKMKIAILAIDHCKADLSDKQRAALKKEIAQNLPQLLRNITRFHFKSNCKKFVKAFILLLK